MGLESVEMAFEKAGHGCTTVTLPGHDPQQPPSALEGLGLADYAKAVETVVGGFEKPILVGHSFGGLIAQQVAARADLAALVLLCSAASGQVFPLRPARLLALTRHFARWNLWKRSARLPNLILVAPSG
jgi:pimeloyl-ACP methyl ester carboxylesterase